MPGDRVPENAKQLGKLQFYIGGEWTESESGRWMDATSPSTGAVIGSVPMGTREDARRAVGAAKLAESVGRWMTASERSRLCHRVGESLEAHHEELSWALALDQGKPLSAEAKLEAASAPHFYHQAAEDILRLNGEFLPSQDANKRVVTFYQSRGTYAVITPWNFPYNIASEYLSGAFASGNPVVWVPAPSASACVLVFAKAVVEADLPVGMFNVVTGEGPVVGDEIVADPRTVGVGFTGSPETGHLIAQRAAGKSLLLELGGNGPVIVLRDADLDSAADGIVFSAYFNAGQACSATERVLVDSSVADELLAKVLKRTDEVRLGDPFDDATTMGPLNNEMTALKMDRHVEEAVSKGAVVHRGGQRAEGFETNLYYEPTVLTGVHGDMAINREESFGPIVPFIEIDGIDGAIDAANDNKLGLICSVYTKNLKAAFYAAERLRTGIVNINETPDYWESHIPYGGGSGTQSGLGRLGGSNTLREMMDVRSMIIDLEKGGF